MIHVYLLMRDSIEISRISSVLNVSFLRLHYRKSDAFLLPSEVTSVLPRERIDLTVPLADCLKVMARVQWKPQALRSNYTPNWICNPSNLIKSEPFLNSRWVWCIPHIMNSDWMFPWVFQHQHVGQTLTLSRHSCCVFVEGKESIGNSVFSVDTYTSWRSEAMICFTLSE